MTVKSAIIKRKNEDDEAENAMFYIRKNSENWKFTFIILICFNKNPLFFIDKYMKLYSKQTLFHLYYSHHGLTVKSWAIVETER